MAPTMAWSLMEVHSSRMVASGVVVMLKAACVALSGPPAHHRRLKQRKQSILQARSVVWLQIQV